MLKILGLIPARSGSKRIKNKNIRLLGKKPLVAYTIEAAKKSKMINRVIMTTNSKKIAAVGHRYGAETPFLRPEALSQNDSTEFEYHEHAINWLKNNENYQPDLIVNLYPTTPFRKSETIDKAIRSILGHPEVDSLRSVTICSEHPYKMWQLEGKYLKPFFSSESQNTHTLSYHLLPKVYIQNASIYIIKPKTLLKYHNTVGEKVLAFMMDQDESVDVNFEIDFTIAEILLNRQLSK